MTLPKRHGSTDFYRYGFQGQEKDDEVKGEGNSLNYKYRMHDTRVGRFFAVDPLTDSYPWYTPYSFSGNKVIQFRELEGLEELLCMVDEGTGMPLIQTIDGKKLFLKSFKYALKQGQQYASNASYEFAFKKLNEGWKIGDNGKKYNVFTSRNSYNLELVEELIDGKPVKYNIAMANKGNQYFSTSNVRSHLESFRSNGWVKAEKILETANKALQKVGVVTFIASAKDGSFDANTLMDTALSYATGNPFISIVTSEARKIIMKEINETKLTLRNTFLESRNQGLSISSSLLIMHQNNGTAGGALDSFEIMNVPTSVVAAYKAGYISDYQDLKDAKFDAINAQIEAGIYYGEIESSFILEHTDDNVIIHSIFINGEEDPSTKD